MIKILFIDTSALLSFFVSDKATPTMRWLFSSENTARYIINHQVITEFEERIKEMTMQKEIKQATADNILNLFNAHYKNRTLEVVGKDASIQKTIEGVYHFLGRITRPILVTCNHTQATDIEYLGYQTINPQTHTTKEIDEIFIEEEIIA